MKNAKLILLLIIAPFILSNGNKENQKVNPFDPGTWSGTVTWSKTSASKGKRKWDDHGKENVYRWDFFFEFKITVSFVNSKGTVVRIDKTTNWEKDSLIFVHPQNKYMIEEKTKTINCNGQGVSDLSVEFSEDKKNYWISFFTPDCPEQLTYDVKNNIHGDIHNQSVNDHQGIQITLPSNFTGQPTGNNPNVLSGTFEEIIPAPNDPGGGEIITRATWNLRKKCPPWKNPLTDQNINTLDARVKGPASRFIKRVNDELCIKLKVVSGKRSNAQQDDLYAQGRTKPGKIVTNAKGGESNHNSGLAIDVYMVFEDGTIDTEGILPPEVIKIASQEGFEWGGSWKKFKDYPHFEMKF